MSNILSLTAWSQMRKNDSFTKYSDLNKTNSPAKTSGTTFSKKRLRRTSCPLAHWAIFHLFRITTPMTLKICWVCFNLVSSQSKTSSSGKSTIFSTGLETLAGFKAQFWSPQLVYLAFSAPPWSQSRRLNKSTSICHIEGKQLKMRTASYVLQTKRDLLNSQGSPNSSWPACRSSWWYFVAARAASRDTWIVWDG